MKHICIDMFIRDDNMPMISSYIEAIISEAAIYAEQYDISQTNVDNMKSYDMEETRNE